MINPTDITNRLLDLANTAAAWGDATAADMMNEAAAAIITLDAELTRVKSAWEVEATFNEGLTEELEAARARIAALEAEPAGNAITKYQVGDKVRYSFPNDDREFDGVVIETNVFGDPKIYSIQLNTLRGSGCREEDIKPR